MARWALGLAILFAVIAIVARILQFGAYLLLFAVAGIALLVWVGSLFAKRERV